MKKFILLSLVVTVSIISVIAQEENVINHLKNCSYYTESGNIDTEGMKVNVVKTIIGLDGDKCVYKEKVDFSGVTATTTCRFTQSQISELVKVTDAFSLVQQYSSDNIDTSSIEAVKDNPIVKVWNKFLQDTSTCTIQADTNK